MMMTRRLLAIPLILAASAASAFGSEVRDKAGLFSPGAVKKANEDLAKIERETNIPVTIETVTSLEGVPIDKALAQWGERERIKGLFVLIASREHKVETGASPEFDKFFNRALYQSMREEFVPGFKKNDYDGGLATGVAKIETTLLAVKDANGGVIKPGAARPARGVPARGQANAPAPAKASSGLGTLVMIVLLVLGVFILFRVIGALFGASRGAGGPGYGPGPMRGPGGYGAPGYGGGGGGGGGFMSSLFGGIGGAMAGNWLYDQFSGGRHRGYDQGGAVPPADQGIAPADDGGQWGTAGDGGADWGGGGQDTGGGGGDWGGGGGGGDWGGGGGGGGDWGGGGGGDGGSW